MTLTLCPIAIVHAPADRVWALLSEPANYALWWDAQTRAIEPAGPATRGQRIYAETRALGRTWPVAVAIERVDAAQRSVDTTTQLPFGLTVRNHIVVAPIDGATCRVSFG